MVSLLAKNPLHQNNGIICVLSGVLVVGRVSFSRMSYPLEKKRKKERKGQNKAKKATFCCFYTKQEQFVRMYMCT